MNQNSFSKNSEIVVAEFNEDLKSELNRFYIDDEVLWFNYDSLLVESVREIIEESYQSSDRSRRIFIEAKKINSISQNALLKLFEEPPKNLNFTLIVPSKSILLPTIRSRLPLKTVVNESRGELSLDVPKLDSIDLHSLHRFLNSLESIDKRDLSRVLEKIFQQNILYSFTEDDLERFQIATQLIALGSNPKRVFLMLLLKFANQNG